MVALHVELAVHAFGIREGRRVEEDEVVGPAAAFREPGEAVFLDERMLAAQPVDREVALRPLDVGARHVDAGRGARAASCRLHRRHSRVTEEVEEALALRELADERARLAVIEEQPGVEVVGEVHQDLEAGLLHHHALVDLGDRLVL